VIDIRSVRVIVIALASILATLVVAATAAAGPGKLESRATLNVHSDLGTEFDDIGTDRVGILVAGGFSGEISPPEQFGTEGVIASFLQNGSLETAFSGDGYLTTSFGRYDRVWKVQLDAHDDVLALVLSGSEGDGRGPHAPLDTVVARYLPDGSPDQSFGDGGAIRIPRLVGSGLEIDQSGRILVAGWASATHRAVVSRYLPDGSLDPSFGIGGTVDLRGRGTSVSAVGSGHHGRVVVVGSEARNGRSRFWVVRLNDRGERARPFSGDGLATVGFGQRTRSRANAVVLRPQGKVAVAGYVLEPDGAIRFAVARLTARGTLDPSFSLDGRVVTGFGFSGSGGVDYVEPGASDLAPVNGGRLIVAGSVGRPFFSGKIALARYRADGSLDPRFGHRGKVTTSFPGCAAANAVVASEFDRFAVAGFQYGCDEQEDGYEGPPNAGAIAIYER